MSRRALIAAAGLAAVAALPARQSGKTVAMEPEPLPEGIPDRLCIEGDSPFYSSATLYVGVRIDGEQNSDVVEYSVSGRWVRLGVRGSDGQIKRVPMHRYRLETTRQDDVTVEPYWREKPSRQVRRAMARGK